MRNGACMLSTPMHFLLQIGMVLANLAEWATGNFFKCTILLPAILIFIFIFRFTLKSESESHWVVADFLWPHGLYSPWNSPGYNTGVGSVSLLQGTFPTQGSNPDLPHCRRSLYQLSHKESVFMQWHNYIFMFHFGSQMGNTKKRREMRRQKVQLKTFASLNMI